MHPYNTIMLYVIWWHYPIAIPGHANCCPRLYPLSLQLVWLPNSNQTKAKQKSHLFLNHDPSVEWRLDVIIIMSMSSLLDKCGGTSWLILMVNSLHGWWVWLYIQRIPPNFGERWWAQVCAWRQREICLTHIVIVVSAKFLCTLWLWLVKGSFH